MKKKLALTAVAVVVGLLVGILTKVKGISQSDTAEGMLIATFVSSVLLFVYLAMISQNDTEKKDAEEEKERQKNYSEYKKVSLITGLAGTIFATTALFLSFGPTHLVMTVINILWILAVLFYE